MKKIILALFVLCSIQSVLYSVTITRSIDLETREIHDFGTGAYIQRIELGDRQEMTEARGNKELDQAVGSKFSVHAMDPLNIKLKDGSTLFLRNEDVVFKSGDYLNIVGRNNEIHVENDLILSSDALRFSDGAELKVIFSGANAKVTFAENTVIDLENGTEITFEGNGIVQFGKGSVVNFKTTVSEIKPWFILKDSAKLTMVSTGGKLHFRGKGSIRVDDNARIDIDATSATEDAGIIIGNVSTDDISVKILGDAELKLKGDSMSNRFATFSFNEGRSELNVDQSGIVSLFENGLLEINTLNGVISSANFTSIYFGPNTLLYLYPYGIFSVAPNENELPILGGHNIVWNTISTTIGREVDGNIGAVRYVTLPPVGSYPNRDFTGKIYLSHAYFDTGSSGDTALNIARILTNINSNLAIAIEYVGMDEVGYVRLANGASATITSGDRVYRENSTGTIVYASSSSGRSVRYEQTSVSPYWRRV